MMTSVFPRRSAAAYSIGCALAVACGVAALLLALAGNRFGYDHGFDHWNPEGIEYENVKVAAAISVVYHTDKVTWPTRGFTKRCATQACRSTRRFPTRSA